MLNTRCRPRRCFFALFVACVWLSLPTASICADPATSATETVLRTAPACSQVQNMPAGKVAPCTGFLVPDALLTQAAEYKRVADVLLPAAEARVVHERTQCKQTCAAEKVLEREHCEGRCEVMMRGCSGPSVGLLLGVGAGSAVVAAGVTALVFLLR